MSAVLVISASLYQRGLCQCGLYHCAVAEQKEAHSCDDVPRGTLMRQHSSWRAHNEVAIKCKIATYGYYILAM